MSTAAAVGHVYVIGFSNGTVKVGRSQNAKQRLGQHTGDARKFGITVTGAWASPAHIEWLQNEERLKGIARDLGGTAVGAEYFSGIEFAAVREQAFSLTFTEPTVTPAPALAVTPAPRTGTSATPGDVSPSVASQAASAENLGALWEFVTLLSGDLYKAERHIADLEKRLGVSPVISLWNTGSIAASAAAELKDRGISPASAIAGLSGDSPHLAREIAALMSNAA